MSRKGDILMLTIIEILLLIATILVILEGSLLLVFIFLPYTAFYLLGIIILIQDKEDY